jgi:hypothetical protein
MKHFTVAIYCHYLVITMVILVYCSEWQQCCEMAVNYSGRKFYSIGHWCLKNRLSEIFSFFSLMRSTSKAFPKLRIKCDTWGGGKPRTSTLGESSQYTWPPCPNQKRLQVTIFFRKWPNLVKYIMEHFIVNYFYNLWL